LLGMGTTLCVPETKRKTLEELAEELHGEVDITKRVVSVPSDDEDKIADSV
jgi:MFS transporter, PHS family, inorganic phosphate transporter